MELYLIITEAINVKAPKGGRFGEQKNFHYESDGYEAAPETRGYL
jgi:hypothetical protein